MNNSLTLILPSILSALLTSDLLLLASLTTSPPPLPPRPTACGGGSRKELADFARIGGRSDSSSMRVERVDVEEGVVEARKVEGRPEARGIAGREEDEVTIVGIELVD